MLPLLRRAGNLLAAVLSVGAALKLAPKSTPHVFSFVSSVSGLPSPGVELSQMQIAVTTMRDSLTDVRYLTKDNFDYKPMFSPQDGKITFFRTTSSAEAWETAQIMVINSDGSNLHSISGDMRFNVNPAWMRDGSNRVFWTHIAEYTHLNYEGCLPHEWCPWRAYINCDTCGQGEIQTLSDHEELGELEKQGILAAEFAYDSFHDGRILLIRQMLTIANDTVRTMPYTLRPPGTPHVQGMRTKEFFKLDGLDWDVFVHKVTLSPSEKYMSYMRNGAEGADYRKSMLYYCSLDAGTLTLSDEVLISTDESTRYWDWYARFTHDEQYILYSSNRGAGSFHIWRYHLGSRETTQLTQLGLDFRYPCPVGMTTFNAHPRQSEAVAPSRTTRTASMTHSEEKLQRMLRPMRRLVRWAAGSKTATPSRRTRAASMAHAEEKMGRTLHPIRRLVRWAVRSFNKPGRN